MGGLHKMQQKSHYEIIKELTNFRIFLKHHIFSNNDNITLLLQCLNSNSDMNCEMYYNNDCNTISIICRSNISVNDADQLQNAIALKIFDFLTTSPVVQQIMTCAPDDIKYIYNSFLTNTKDHPNDWIFIELLDIKFYPSKDMDKMDVQITF